VALVITGLEVGGAEKCLTQLALGLDRRRFRPHVFALQSRPQPPKDALVRQLAAADIPVEFLEARSALSFPRVLWRLWRAFRREKPQVVQTFLYHANVIGVLAARLAGIRNVHVGIRVAEPSAWRRRVEELVYSFAADLIYVSKSVRRFYRWRRIGIPIVITNGVDVDLYQQAEPADLSSYGIAADTPVIAFVGRLHAQNGLDWFLGCLPELLQRLSRHHVVLAGDGPERENLLRQTESLGLSNRVHFLGWRKDVPQLLKRADLLGLPSRYEGMPNVVMEAMAAGTPVVSTRIEGIYELLGSHAHELTVTFGDSRRLIDRITRLATDRALHEQTAAQLLERAREKFSIQAKTIRYQIFWEEPTVTAATAYPAIPSPRRGIPAPEADSI
jgi:glycosyltransferase involved in cell wall biosynthesis